MLSCERGIAILISEAVRHCVSEAFCQRAVLRIHTTKKTRKGWATQSSTCVFGARHADFPDADLAEVDDESDFVCPVRDVREFLGQTICLLLRPHQ